MNRAKKEFVLITVILCFIAFSLSVIYAQGQTQEEKGPMNELKMNWGRTKIN